MNDTTEDLGRCTGCVVEPAVVRILEPNGHPIGQLCASCLADAQDLSRQIHKLFDDALPALQRVIDRSSIRPDDGTPILGDA